MTFEEAVAQQPLWVNIWLNWMLVGAFVLPVVLLIWRASRIAGIVTLVTGVTAGFAITMMYDQMGYVKLLGLPHVLLWTPLAYYLYRQQARPEMPVWPQRIIWVVMATILISLAFDYTDVIRYLLGNRTPTFLPA